MKTLFRLLMLIFSLGGWVLAAASLYVIRTPEKISILPRDRIEFKQIQEVWTDARPWTMADVSAHPAVVRRLIERDKADLLRFLAPDEGQRDFDRMLREAVEKGESAPTLPATATPTVRAKADLLREVVAQTAKTQAGDEGDSWLTIARSLDFD